jgi:hypothetical protein
MKTNFKSPEYLANTGIVFGPYGGIGYYNTNPVAKRSSIKRACVRMRKACFPDLFKKLISGFAIENAS